MTFHPVVVVTLALISAVGIIGNLLIIGVICLYRQLRVRGNMFIVNLAVADLIIVAYIMPIGIVTSQYNSNPFGDVMCQINAFLVTTSCGVSTQSLMLIAIERFFHICKAQYYRKVFTPKLVGMYVAITWIYTSVWTCQGWTGWTVYVYGQHSHICLFSGYRSRSYNACLSFFGMFLPLTVLVVCYYKIFRSVMQSRRVIRAHRRRRSSQTGDQSALTTSNAERETAGEHRLTVTLFAIVVIFGICWLPSSLVLAIFGVWRTMPKNILYPISIWIALCNSSMNSIIYGVLNNKFRAGYKHILRTVFICGRNSKCRGCKGLFTIQEEETDRPNSDPNPGSVKTTSVSPGEVGNITPRNDCRPTSAIEPTAGQTQRSLQTRGDKVICLNSPLVPENGLKPAQYDSVSPSGAFNAQPFGRGVAGRRPSRINENQMAAVHVRDDLISPPLFATTSTQSLNDPWSSLSKGSVAANGPTTGPTTQMTSHDVTSKQSLPNAATGSDVSERIMLPQSAATHVSVAAVQIETQL